MKSLKQLVNFFIKVNFWIGLGSFDKNEKTYKKIIYKLYILVLLVLSIYYTYILSVAYFLKKKIFVSGLLDLISYSITLLANVVLYVDAVLRPFSLSLVFEEFQKIDEILKSTFSISIDNKAIALKLYKITFVILLILFVIMSFRVIQNENQIVLFILTLLNHITCLNTMILFGFICWHIKIRYNKLELYLSNTTTFSHRFEAKFSSIQQIFYKLSTIILYCNRYFGAKLLFTMSKKF